MYVQVRPQLLALQSVAAATEEAPSSAHRMLLLPSLGIAAVVLGSALLLSIVFALISSRTEPCRSYSCARFARNLRESMNRSFNPCYSFTRFVCDGWQQHHAHSVRTEIFMSALERLSRLTRDTVDGTPTDHRGSGGRMRTSRERIAALYRSCDAVVRDGRNEMPHVKKALAEAGVFWPVRSRTPDVLRTVLYLSEILHWPAIVSIRANEDSSSGRPVSDVWRTTVVVREAHTFPRMLSRQARLRTVNESRQFFDVLHAHFASGGGSDHEGVTFEQMRAVELKMLPPLSRAYQGVLHVEPKPLDDGVETLVNHSEWTAAVARHWAVAGHRGIRILATNPAFLHTFLALLRQYGESDTHLYVSWCAVRYAALFANMELVLNHYGADQSKALLNYGRACFAMTYTFVGDLVFALYDSDVVVRPSTNINVHSLVRDVRGAFVRRLTSSSSRPFAANTSFASRWHTVDSALRLVDMPTDASTEEVALPLEVSDSLVTNWLALWSLTRTPGYVAPRKSLSARPFQDCMFYTINETESDFVLSPFTLVLPFYDDGITAAVKYGGLGTQLWEQEEVRSEIGVDAALIRTDVSSADFDTFPKFKEPLKCHRSDSVPVIQRTVLVSLKVQTFREPLQCGIRIEVGVASAELAFRFYHHLPDAEAALNESRSCLKFSSTSPASPASPDLLMAELASIEAVLDAFVSSGHGEDDRWLVTPQLSPVQVQNLRGRYDGFRVWNEVRAKWRAHSMQVLLITWCFVKCPGREEPGVEGDPCSDVLRHVPRFSQAFDCPPETVLNPTHKCSVF
ncbi:hypothetical protein HPB51_029254 [Rhipicephalus microplus]|uniref:Peptidase M13 N-terminal domain-containing protein n=1 Tax=Rhipicephalus microplus TaxID=6941 RepID=A0A9J6CUS4_RHIMP|nr:hypothetical protein HPB51_029254 [Rhipicephalus microplus]